MGALEAAKASGNYEYALDLGMAWTGEWYPYAFSPFLQSFGGDIVDRSTYQTAEGALNGDAALAFGEWWQSLFANDYAPGTSQDGADRDSGFIDGKYAFQWNGNWAGVTMLSFCLPRTSATARSLAPGRGNSVHPAPASIQKVLPHL